MQTLQIYNLFVDLTDVMFSFNKVLIQGQAKVTAGHDELRKQYFGMGCIKTLILRTSRLRLHSLPLLADGVFKHAALD